MSAITRITPEVVDLVLAAAEYDAEQGERAAVEAAKPTVEEIKAAFWAERALDMTSSPTPDFIWPSTPAGAQKSLATEIEAAFWAARSPEPSETVEPVGTERGFPPRFAEQLADFFETHERTVEEKAA